jgi:hypothetical protein
MVGCKRQEEMLVADERALSRPSKDLSVIDGGPQDNLPKTYIYL